MSRLPRSWFAALRRKAAVVGIRCAAVLGGHVSTAVAEGPVEMPFSSSPAPSQVAGLGAGKTSRAVPLSTGPISAPQHSRMKHST